MQLSPYQLQGEKQIINLTTTNQSGYQDILSKPNLLDEPYFLVK